MSGELVVKAPAAEWELVEPVPDLRPLTAADLQKMMGFDRAGMFYGAPPCAHFAKREDADGKEQP